MIIEKVGKSGWDGSRYWERTHEVSIDGQLLGELREGDSRGTIKRLYQLGEGKLLLYMETYSNWQGEGSNATLQFVEERDLQPGGGYEWLGQACGFGRPLTLDEAIAAHGPANR